MKILSLTHTADGETESRSRRSTQFCEDTGKGELIDSHQTMSTDMGPPHASKMYALDREQSA